jgi:hypothetical protein
MGNSEGDQPKEADPLSWTKAYLAWAQAAEQVSVGAVFVPL